MENPANLHDPPPPPGAAPATSDPHHQQLPNIPDYNHENTTNLYYQPPPPTQIPNPLAGLDPNAYAAQAQAQAQAYAYAYAAAIAPPPHPSSHQELALQIAPPPHPSSHQELALQIAPRPLGVELQGVNCQIFKNKAPKAVKSVYCHVCNIDCNSQKVLDKHKLGRKHERKLQKLKESLKQQLLSQPKPTLPTTETKSEGETKKKKNTIPASAENIESKKRKLVEGGAAQEEMKVCTICNVVCNSQVVFAYHLAGKKHTTMVKNQEASTK